jgi:TonB family protein
MIHLPESQIRLESDQLLGYLSAIRSNSVREMFMLKKIFITFIFYALTFATFSMATRAQSLDLKNLRQSVVSVISYDKDGKILARGTGFIMNPLAQVLTSLSNLPAEAVRTEIRTLDGKSYEMTRRMAEYKAINAVRLVVNFPKDGIKPIRYSGSNPEVGDRVALVSVNSSSEAIITEGTITAIEDSPNKMLFKISALIPEESVGGPVLNMKGEVIGLVNDPKAEGQVFYAASISSIWQLTSVDKRPKLLNNPSPKYTEEARRNMVEGKVRVRVLIGKDGLVKQVRITEGIPDDLGLNEQAIKAAFKLKFEPAIKDGQPVSFWQSVEVEFKLKR